MKNFLAFLIALFFVGCEFKQFSTVPLPPPQIEIDSCYVEMCSAITDFVSCLDVYGSYRQQENCLYSFNLSMNLYEERYKEDSEKPICVFNNVEKFTNMSYRKIEDRIDSIEKILNGRGCEVHPNQQAEVGGNWDFSCVSSIIRDMSRTFQCDRLLSSI